MPSGHESQELTTILVIGQRKVRYLQCRRRKFYRTARLKDRSALATDLAPREGELRKLSFGLLRMKAIFLDIDGVLNCDATPNPRRFPYVVDPPLLERFKALVKATSATVVLSSSWRVDPIGRLAAQFYGIPFDDICPDLPAAPRCDVLQTWLGAHPDVTRYAVIDDEDDCLDELPLFQPSAKTGITRGIAQGVEAFLAGERDTDMRQNALVRLGQNIQSWLKRDKD